MKQLFFASLFTFFSILGFCQSFNNNTDKTYLNIALPKTPESQSFEKYGNIPVNESSGIPNITFPLLSLKSRFLEAPVSLAYHASGIKVNQEATWVGLGFDLIAGGRVTVATKGNVDENVRSNFTSASIFKTGIGRIFNRWGTSSNRPLLGYGFLDYGTLSGASPPWNGQGDTTWDNDFTIKYAAWFGIAEPDIYTASFGGNSFSFYFDLITDEIKFIGEKNLYAISADRDGAEKITKFTIVDNNGTQYHFAQKEKTKLTAPPFHGQTTSYESTTAWLLTMIKHVTGDSIVYSYTGIGKIYPAFNWSSSISVTLPNNSGTLSSDWPQNQIEQEPFYLTKIESTNATIDFILSTRQDIRGPGARKVDSIKLTDKISNTLIQRFVFNYDYFTSATENCESTLHDTIKQYYHKRLKLVSFKAIGGSQDPTYSFFYGNPTCVSKLSLSQDHWGFYNGANNSAYLNGSSPANLIPTFSGLGNLSTRNIGVAILQSLSNNPGSRDASTIPNNFDGYANSRNCNANEMTMMMMDSIVYPTGGSTKFEYEPHRSYYQNKGISDLIGGGARIKSIKNYSSSFQLENITEYKYEETDGGSTSGIYLGAIEYVRIGNKSAYNGSNWPYSYSTPNITLSSNGEINDDNQTVGYTRVKVITKDRNLQANAGYVIKFFNFQHTHHVYHNSLSRPFTSNWGTSGVDFLLKKWSMIPPAPYRSLDGKMYKEEVFNSTNNLVKSTNYYYRQADYSEKFYSMKVEDNYVGADDNILYGSNDNGGGVAGGNPEIGWTRWLLCLSPAKSFYSLLDSVVEKTYVGSNYLTQKKSYKYNNYFQPEFVSTYNSDGTQSIAYSKTPLSFIRPPIPTQGEGDAYLIEKLKSNHIYEVPIEQISLIRETNGDTLVTQGVYNVYDTAVQKKAYILETISPLTFRSQFIPTYYYHNYPTVPDFSLTLDTKYKLREEAFYNPTKLTKQITNPKGTQSYIWDESYNNLLAHCINATPTNIAYTSFETNAKGNWEFSGTPVTDANAPTGAKAYSLSNGTITKNSLNSTLTYTISYWSKNGAQSVYGSTTSINGRSQSGFTYYEHKVVNPSGGTISISGSGTIDELRIYPIGSLMTTYTYKANGGLSAQSNVNNQISYYDYDELNRLTLIRDQEKNILKKMEYKLQETYSYTYGNALASQQFTKNNCASGYAGNGVIYVVPQGKYGSFISQADANQKAQDEITANGQSYANANGYCYLSYSFSTCCNWGSAYWSFALNSGSVNFSLVLYKTNGSTSAYGQVGTLTGSAFLPSASRYVSVSSGGQSFTLVFYPNGQVDIMGSSFTGYIQLTGSYNL